MFHITDQGDYGPCHASTPENCPYDKHFETEDETRKYSERIVEEALSGDVPANKMSDEVLKIALNNALDRLSEKSYELNKFMKEEYTPLSEEFMEITANLKKELEQDAKREDYIANYGGGVLREIQENGGENEYLFKGTAFENGFMDDRIKLRYQILRKDLPNGYVYRKPIMYFEDFDDLEIYDSVYKDNFDKLQKDRKLINERLPYYHIYLDKEDFRLRPETRGKQPRRFTGKEVRNMYNTFDFSRIPEDYVAYHSSVRYKEVAPKFLDAIDKKKMLDDDVEYYREQASYYKTEKDNRY